MFKKTTKKLLWGVTDLLKKLVESNEKVAFTNKEIVAIIKELQDDKQTPKKKNRIYVREQQKNGSYKMEPATIATTPENNEAKNTFAQQYQAIKKLNQGGDN